MRNLDGAEECELEIRDILRADRIFACNALRGIRVVHSIQTTDRQTIWKQNSSYIMDGEEDSFTCGKVD